VAARNERDRVTVGRGPAAASVRYAVGARPVLDDDLLLEILGKLLRDCAAENIVLPRPAEISK